VVERGQEGRGWMVLRDPEYTSMPDEPIRPRFNKRAPFSHLSTFT
jgi:hypothetical protein